MVFFENKEKQREFLKDFWGKGLKCPSPPQDPFSARRCKILL